MKNLRSLEVVTSLPLGWKHVKENSFLVIYHLSNVDDLVQSGFWFQKFYLLIYVNQFRTHNFPDWSDSLNLETGKERKKLEKLEYLENEKSFLDERESFFHNLWNAFFMLSLKKEI